MTGRAALAALALLVLSTTGALAISCERATSRIDHAVCASPALRRADAAMASAYVKIRDATRGQVKAGFVAQQKAWLRSRDATCAQAAASCLLLQYGTRQAQLDALLARVGWDETNLLSDTTPWHLAGSWKASSPQVLSGQPMSPKADLAASAQDDGLPPSGTIVTGQPGKLCYGADCFVAGLQAVPLSTFYGDRQAAALGLQSSAPTYAITVTKEHVLRLIEGDHRTLQVLFEACAPLHKNCVVAEQPWAPQGIHAEIQNMLNPDDLASSATKKE